MLINHLAALVLGCDKESGQTGTLEYGLVSKLTSRPFWLNGII